MSSTPSTPRTTRSASRDATSPAMLTPGQKIKAMMAAYDSDSDSDTQKPVSKNQQPVSATHNGASMSDQPPPNMNANTVLNDKESDDDEDEDIVMPRGRMAARLQGQNAPDASSAKETAFERVSRSLRESKKQDESEPARDEDEPAKEDLSDDDDDDLPTAGRRRRGAPENKELSDREDGSERAPSPSPARDMSPLFVSSPGSARDEEPRGNEQAGSDDDDEPKPKANARFLALVAQKRKEREEKERLEAEKKAEKAKKQEQFSSELALDEEDSGSDDAGGSAKKLSQKPRAPRKASKKAMEEMNRETQRMSRNMQLTHQAQTKKKITKESFFAWFQSGQPAKNTAPDAGAAHDSSSTAGGSQNSSDVEANKGKETPHTSPILGPSDKPSTENGPSKESVSESTALPQQQEQPVVAHVQEHTAKPHPARVESKKEREMPIRPPPRIRLSRQQVAQNQDSDDELEIITSPGKVRRYAAFENLPAKRQQEPASMLRLKALAHLTSPTRRSAPSMADLSLELMQKARQQAAKLRDERIEELRAKGIHVETAEERARMEDEIENLVERARQEGEDIARQEKAEAKRENGDDGDEDEDYLSGSDEEAGGDGDNEDEDEDEDDDEEEENKPAGGKEGAFFDSEAGEDDESEDDRTETMSTGEPDVPTQRRKRPTRVIADDEDEDEPQVPSTPPRQTSPAAHSAERPQIPGMPSNDMTMSLTQAFAGTMGSPQVSQLGSPTIPQSLPDPAQAFEHQGSDSQTIIKDSQEPRAESTDILAGYAPSEARVSESPAPRWSQQVPDPTQDEGFVLSPFDPNKRFMGTPTSTIETVLLNQKENSPIPERKKKHLRRGKELSVIEEQGEDEDEDEGDFEVNASAFNVMKKAAKKKKKPAVPFDRNKSKAKEVVEDAAEESEDEYAGLGGASDEDDEEENAQDRQMINDNSGETVDEKQLAALNALHQRNADEKQVAKLLKDITTGALRRRRNGDDDLDLDDSDDELMSRRREKQREFARMRRALLADEKVGEIAENPKKAAFFKAIEDRDDDDDDLGLEFLDYEENTGSQEASSSQDASAQPQAPQAQANNTTAESNKRKRPLEPSAEDINNRPPPSMRRKPANAMSKKPASLSEIRETLSFLTERPEYDSFHEDASMDDDEAPAEFAEESPAPPDNSKEEFIPSTHTHPRRTRGPVIDRLALLRQASSNSATSASSNNKLAFHAGSGNMGSNFGFRPPTLRKTVTGSSGSTSTSSGKSDSSKMSKAKAAGVSVAKKSAVNSYTAAREKEREKELRLKQRGSGSNITALLNKHAGSGLGALGGKGQWE